MSLNEFERLWTNLNDFEQVWTILVKFKIKVEQTKAFCRILLMEDCVDPPQPEKHHKREDYVSFDSHQLSYHKMAQETISSWNTLRT